MTIPQTFQWALERHQAGLLADAEAGYRQILAAQPNHADALHLLGVIAHQTGNHDLAVEWIRKAIGINPAGLHYYLNLGNALTAQGRLGEAIATYRRALELNPNYPEALNNLGAALAGQGHVDDAMAAYRRALELKPDYAEAHNNLGNTLRLRGKFDGAAAACRRALELRPDYPEAHNNLGAALAGRFQFDQAIAAYRRALELRPDYAEAHNNLGAALARQGQLDEAMAAYRHALGLRPDYAEAWNNLGAALARQGQLADAIAAHRRALELRPDYPEAYNNLGNALKEDGQLAEALAVYRHALELKPNISETHNNLGNALSDQGQLDEGIAAYRRALELNPEYPEAWNNLGRALRKQGRLDAATVAYRRALALKPGFAEAHSNLGDILRNQGELDEAIAAFRRSLQIEPGHAWAHSNLIYALHFHPGHNSRTIAEEHERWNRQFSDPLKPFVHPHTDDRGVARRLRVGYVPPDFLDRAVARFLLPLLERHNREQFEILCYSGAARSDRMTERFRALAGRWRDIARVSDARLAETIREDGVDILVDLSLHTADNRLPVFALQPAPVQVTWLGYAGSAGLPSIGYRLTDSSMDPPGEDLAASAETPVRLPDCWCCYHPVDDSPEINALPALSARGVTFGSLNNFAKVHEGVLRLWARVLEAVKGSRLLMFCPEGRARERVRAFLGARGIGLERLEIVGYLPCLEYLRLYLRIDVGLDPFPFNGMTTTCDALWMGTPVLTLPGEMPVSRAGLSLLSTVGLGEFAASSEDDYVRMAVELAGNLPRLANLRATLRARMLASPLMDAPRFARNVEAAYRSMWEAWLQKQSSMSEKS